ncbi:MAG: winged helix DNA-binding protein [Eubacteriales bacterium]|nr:winged helix DNA-binding protein [Eubacteriales bacterium]
MQLFYSKPLCKIADLISSRGEDQVLLLLYSRRTPACAGDFAACLGLTSGRVANLLKQLERKEYIMRTSDPGDRRRVQISLTEKGNAYASETYEKTLRDYKWLLTRLGDKDSQEFMHVLKLGVTLLGQHEELFKE